MATPATSNPNYTLGRGELHFARFIGDTQNPAGESYIGNTPELSLTIAQEVLDHFSSDHGIREKDESIALQVNRTGSFTTDNVNPENIGLFFFGSTSTVTEAGGPLQEVLEDVEQGKYYQLGLSASRPAGAKGLIGDTDDSNSAGGFAAYLFNDSNSIDDFNDSNSGVAALVATTDYVLDPELGRLYIVPGGGIADGASVFISATVKASTYSRVISGSQPVEGAMRFLAFNPNGDDIDYYFPWAKISPNGDYALKSDAWQTIPFNIEILKRTDREAIYADGRPAFT